MVVATSGWNTWITYSIFMFVFLPYYVRTGLYTMPEFLERRYNSTCRYLFAVSLVIGYVFTLLAGLAVRRRAGDRAACSSVQMPADRDTNIKWGIVLFAVTTGAYTIYGGMKSSAWTDFLQMIVMLLAGILLPDIGPAEDGRPVGVGPRVSATNSTYSFRRRTNDSLGPACSPDFSPWDCGTLRESAHRATRALCKGRMACAHGCGERRISPHPHAVVFCDPRYRRIQAVSRIGHHAGWPGPGVSDAGAKR